MIDNSRWPSVPFGDVVRLNTDRVADPAAAGIERYVGIEHITPEDLRVRSWGLVAEGTTFTNHFRPGQVLFAKRRAYQRKVAVADFEGVCSGDIYVLESKDPDVLLPELLPFICQTEGFFNHAVDTSAGSLSPRTNWSQLAAYEFPLPPPGEQRRLAQLFDTVGSLNGSYADLALSVKQATSSFYHYVITAYPQTEFVQIGEIARFSSGKQLRVSNLSQQPSNVATIPAYGGNGISGYTDKPLLDTKEFTVVIGRVGQFCGVTHLVKGPVWITDNALFPIHLSQTVDAEYLAICLKGLNLNKGKLGEYLPLINQRVVHDARIPLPSINDQKYWVQKYNDLEHASRIITERHNRLAKLKNVTMKLLSGKE